MKGHQKPPKKPRATRAGKHEHKQRPQEPDPQGQEGTQEPAKHPGGRSPVWDWVKTHLATIEAQRGSGATLLQIASFLGVHVSTLYRLKHEQKEFCDCLARARKVREEFLTGKLWELASGARRIETTISTSARGEETKQVRTLELEPSLPALVTILKREYNWSEPVEPDPLEEEGDRATKVEKLKATMLERLGINPATPLDGYGPEYYAFTESKGFVWDKGQYLGQTVWKGQTPQERIEAQTAKEAGKPTASDVVYYRKQIEKRIKEAQDLGEKLRQVDAWQVASVASAPATPEATQGVAPAGQLDEERQKIEEERQKLEEERQKLSEERQKLDAKHADDERYLKERLQQFEEYRHRCGFT